MKNGTYILKIDSPCGEDWSAMSRTGPGRHCSSCSKTVIDFTGLSDTEISRILSINAGKVCGRFSDTQLHRPIAEASKPGLMSKWYQFFAGLSLLITSQSLRAGENATAVKPVSLEAVPMDSLQKEQHVPAHSKDSSQKTLIGRVTDQQTGIPLDFVAVSVQRNGILVAGVLTGIDGSFKIPLPDSLASDTFTLRIRCTDYDNKEITVDLRGGAILQEIKLTRTSGNLAPIPNRTPVRSEAMGKLIIVR